VVVRRFLGKKGSRTQRGEERRGEERRGEERRGEEKMRKGDSLGDNGSQGGNGLLHLIHIAWGELEHRGN